MKNILHVVNIYFVLPYFLGEQLDYFSEKGYNEHIICSPSKELNPYSIEKRFSFKEIPITRSYSVFKDIKAVKSVCSYIKNNNIDIVVGHTPKGAIIAMLAAKIMKVPTRIYFRHGLVYETSKGLKRFVLKSIDKMASTFATKVVSVSPSVAKKSIEDKLNHSSKQIILNKGTCNGIDIKRFNKNNIELFIINQLKIKYQIKEEYVIGYVGRLVKDKGIIELTESFELLYQLYPNVKLLLVGMFEERDALPLHIVQKIQEHPNIILTDYVDNRDIHNYYALMDVFVLPSYREGFPTSVLEASSMSLPIITTQVTGCIDSIIDNWTGVFVGNNVESLFSALRRLYENSDLAKKLGENGRLFVEENFAQEKIWLEIEKLYQ